MPSARSLALTLALAVVLSGTIMVQHRTSEAETVSRQNTPNPVPEGSVKVGDDVYQVPAGKDADGCQTFRMFSQNKAVVAAMFYRDGDGNFTMDKSKAACTGN